MAVFRLFLGSLLALTNAQCNLRTVCYALDQSGSIDEEQYEVLKNFTVTTARILETLNPTTAYAAVRFADDASLIQATTPDLEGIFIPAVESFPQSDGATNIFAGLQNCFDEIKKTPPGGARLIVLITDGESTVFNVPNPTDSIKNENIAIFTVGIGNGIDEDFLKETATTPQFYVPATFENFVGLGTNVANLACDLVTMMFGPTATPVVSPPPDFCQDAFDECELTFNNTVAVSTFNATGPADAPFTPAIVPKMTNYSVGSLNTNEVIPEFIDFDGARNITEFGQQPFSPKQFKPFVNHSMSASFIGHETYQADQVLLVRDRCVRVFFSSFQILDVNGTVVDNRNNVPKSENKCVVFQTMM